MKIHHDSTDVQRAIVADKSGKGLWFKALHSYGIHRISKSFSILIDLDMESYHKPIQTDSTKNIGIRKVKMIKLML